MKYYTSCEDNESGEGAVQDNKTVIHSDSNADSFADRVKPSSQPREVDLSVRCPQIQRGRWRAAADIETATSNEYLTPWYSSLVAAKYVRFSPGVQRWSAGLVGVEAPGTGANWSSTVRDACRRALMDDVINSSISIVVGIRSTFRKVRLQPFYVK